MRSIQDSGPFVLTIFRISSWLFLPVRPFSAGMPLGTGKSYTPFVVPSVVSPCTILFLHVTFCFQSLLLISFCPHHPGSLELPAS